MKNGDSARTEKLGLGGLCSWMEKLHHLEAQGAYYTRLNRSQGLWYTADRDAGLANSLGALCRGAVFRA